jgi:hypothetical protein
MKEKPTKERLTGCPTPSSLSWSEETTCSPCRVTSCPRCDPLREWLRQNLAGVRGQCSARATGIATLSACQSCDAYQNIPSVVAGWGLLETIGHGPIAASHLWSVLSVSAKALGRPVSGSSRAHRFLNEGCVCSFGQRHLREWRGCTSLGLFWALRYFLDIQQWRMSAPARSSPHAPSQLGESIMGLIILSWC